jgi:hypothetical protein
VFSAYFGPTYIYRWEGDTLVYDGDTGVDGATANALAVSHNHIVIGTNYDGRGGFFEGAEVLTYPKKSTTSSSDTDDWAEVSGRGYHPARTTALESSALSRAVSSLQRSPPDAVRRFFFGGCRRNALMPLVSAEEILSE